MALLPHGASGQADRAWFVGGGAGFGWGSLLVGEDRQIGVEDGMTLLAQVGLIEPANQRLAWFLEAEAQLFDVPHPLVDEYFQAYRALVRRSFFGPFYLTPGIGAEYRRWSGPERQEESDFGPVLAVGFGRPVAMDEALVLMPEIYWSFAFLRREESHHGASVSLRLTLLGLP